MKNIYNISIIIFLLSFSIVTAQQQSMYSQYILNGFVINPAIAGTSQLSPIRLTARKQWVGIKGAPQTQIVSLHTSLGRNDITGAGGYVYHDSFGPISETGVIGAFSYKIRVKNSTMLSFGLAVSAIQYSINKSDLNIIDKSDLLYNQNTDNTVVPDADFGMYLYNSKYFVGLSTTQLFQLPVKIEGTVSQNKTVRHHYLYGGYKFELNNEYTLEPSVLIKTTEQIIPQFDLNSKLYIKQKYWLGISYRHKDAVVVLAGLKINRILVGYSYDYALSNLTNYSAGSHEIIIGFDLNKKLESNTLL